MAQLWRLPVLYMCENNHYAMGTSVERHSGGHNHFYDKLSHLEGIYVDASDYFLIRETLRGVKKFMCDNQLPVYMEVNTYR